MPAPATEMAKTLERQPEGLERILSDWTPVEAAALVGTDPNNVRPPEWDAIEL
ncbi:MAG: hypothetical protein M3065_05325 [Actinomycetota bacterium]|nr:hypothetical protein [Actinomycetota bacterium]